MGQGPSKPKPGSKFRVIGGGMSRTGTKSFAQALTILLDGPVHDAGAQGLFGSSREVAIWRKVSELAARAQTPAEKQEITALIREVVDGYTSTMDVPAAWLVPEQMEAFPDAVVIVTTRDTEGWYKSMQLVEAALTAWWVPLVVFWMPGFGFLRLPKYLHRNGVLRRLRTGSYEWLPSSLEKHEDFLRRVVPKEKLFFYSVSEGWGPLCKILNVPVPDVPFPHSNNPAEVQKVRRQIIVFGLALWLGVLCVVGLAGFGLYRWYHT